MTLFAPLDANSPFLDSKGKLTDRSRTWANAVTRGATAQNWIDVTFQNNWVNFDTTFNDCQFRDLGNQRVEMRGTVKNGTALTTIFTLPEGLRPIRRYAFPDITNLASVTAFGVIHVFADGSVTQIVGSNIAATLDGMIFSLD